MQDRFLEHLDAQRSRIQKQIFKLEEELEKLNYSEKAYRASGAASSPPPTRPTASPGGGLFASASVLPTNLTGTIKERVLTLLEKNPDGLTSGQIHDALRATGWPDLARESLSPQLSRLRNRDRRIDLNRGVWTIRKHEAQSA
jgi:hypothetical protein